MCLRGVGDALQCVNRKHWGGPAESETSCEHLSFMRENRESPDGARECAGRLGKTCGRNPNMHAAGKSDIGVVPSIPLNKASQWVAETE